MDLAQVITDDLAMAVAGADLIFLCTPPAAMPLLARQIAPCLAPRAVVSDVGSVKAGLTEALTSVFPPADPGRGSRFVGGHPMAGAERHGLASARADLFEGRVCLLTPLEGQTDPPAVDLVEHFWRALGAKVTRMTPRAHDEAVALVSHLPHVMAAALADYVGGLGNGAEVCAGPGWRDMTRLAGGAPELWTEILSRNRVPVTNALRGAIGKLTGVLEILEAGRDADLERFLEAAKHRREDFTS